jgi:hypothetical protein
MKYVTYVGNDVSNGGGIPGVEWKRLINCRIALLIGLQDSVHV